MFAGPTLCRSKAVDFSSGGPLLYNLPRLGVQGKYAEAGPLYERSQAVREKVLGPEHPEVAAVLNAQASLLQIQVWLRVTSRKRLHDRKGESRENLPGFFAGVEDVWVFRRMVPSQNPTACW